MGIDVTADISAAHADEYARRAQTATPDEVSALFCEALGEGRFAAHGELDSLRAEVERLKKERDEANLSNAWSKRSVETLRAEVATLETRVTAATEETVRACSALRDARAQLKDSRRAALEEAAGIAERIATGRTSEVFCSMVAAAIRAAAKEER